MARRNLVVHPVFMAELPSLGPRVAAIGLLAAAAAPALVIAMLVPAGLILPVLCFMSLFNAGLAALFAWRSGTPQGGSRITAWDFAGACLFVGFAAGVLSDVEQGAQLFGLLTGAP
jgi:hypothetical protein